MSEEERTSLSVVVSKRKLDAVILPTVQKSIRIGPAFMINALGNRISRGRRAQNVNNVTLVMTFNLMIHRPSVVWRPMPIHHILSLSKKVPFCLTPQIIDYPADTVFRWIILCKILMGSQQAFEHESGFYNIRSIVLTTERNGLAGFTVHPMCPHAVIAVGILVAQKADYLQHTFSALFASDKTTLYTDNDSHHSETRATDGSCLGTSVAPFMRQS